MNLDRKGEKESMREFLPFITASAFRGSDDYDSPNASVTNLHIPDLSPPMKAAHAFRLGKKIGCGPDVKRLICSRPLDGRHVCNLGNQQWSAAIFSLSTVTSISCTNTQTLAGLYRPIISGLSPHI
jgi:hypothetical protein